MATDPLAHPLNSIVNDINAIRARLTVGPKPSRNISLAITKLDEARLWVQEEIAADVISRMAADARKAAKHG